MTITLLNSAQEHGTLLITVGGWYYSAPAESTVGAASR